MREISRAWPRGGGNWFSSCVCVSSRGCVAARPPCVAGMTESLPSDTRSMLWPELAGNSDARSAACPTESATEFVPEPPEAEDCARESRELSMEAFVQAERAKPAEPGAEVVASSIILESEGGMLGSMIICWDGLGGKLGDDNDAVDHDTKNLTSSNIQIK